MTDPDDGPFHYWPQTPPPEGYKFWPATDFTTLADFDESTWSGGGRWDWIVTISGRTYIRQGDGPWTEVPRTWFPRRYRLRRALSWLRRCGR